MFDLAPKEVPWKTGPSRTVRVARSCVTLVALVLDGVGMTRGVLLVTVARDRTEGLLVLEKHVGFAATAGCRKIRANIAEDCIGHWSGSRLSSLKLSTNGLLARG